MAIPDLLHALPDEADTAHCHCDNPAMYSYKSRASIAKLAGTSRTLFAGASCRPPSEKKPSHFNNNKGNTTLLA
eukprot:6180442-Pleurochrysis_carterae.AAC.3